MSEKRSRKTVPIHAAAQQAVNTPPSRDPVLMRRLYERMVSARATGLREHAQRKPALSSLGLEAMLVGALAGLLPEDLLVVPRIGEAIRVASGIPEKHAPVPVKRGKPSRVRLAIDLSPYADDGHVPAAAQIGLSAGIAILRQARRESGVVLAVCGDTLTLHDSKENLQISAAQKLPLVVVTEHNMAASKTARRPRTADLAHAAKMYGVPGMTVDGSDVMAVYRVTQEALYRARHNGGPTLVECKTWRPTGRKILSAPPQRLRHWVQGDPLEYMERQLKARGFWDEEWAKKFALNDKHS